MSSSVETCAQFGCCVLEHCFNAVLVRFLLKLASDVHVGLEAKDLSRSTVIVKNGHFWHLGRVVKRYGNCRNKHKL